MINWLQQVAYFGHNSGIMRITVDIEEPVLEELQRITGKGKKSPAVAEAVREYVKRHQARELGRLLREGAVDYPVTNEELEEQDR